MGHTTLLNNVFDRHEVSAGEAAGNGLFGVYQAQTRWQWMTDLVIADEREDWEILQLEVYHSTAAGLDYHGKLMALIGLPPPGQTIHMLAQNTRCQYAGQRVGLAYPQYVSNGFAVLTGLPSLIAGDIIIVNGIYRKVYHD